MDWIQNQEREMNERVPDKRRHLKKYEEKGVVLCRCV